MVACVSRVYLFEEEEHYPSHYQSNAEKSLKRKADEQDVTEIMVAQLYPIGKMLPSHAFGLFFYGLKKSLSLLHSFLCQKKKHR